LQIVDELLDVFDGVDVVVRRRTDEPDTGRRMARARDPRVDLVARQLTTLAPLCALRHLDLEVSRVDEGLGGPDEATGGPLLDRRSPEVAVFITEVAIRVLTTLASVGLAANAIHRNRERLVGFLRN